MASMWSHQPTAAEDEIARLQAEGDETRFGDLALLLFEQALLSEGASLEDPAAFVRRVNALLTGA